ncbi:hypothetical protein SCLCIDRAFT_1180250, partial [Scleroderma citrinum Foug A]
RMVIIHKQIYEDIVRIGRERKDAGFLDIGYCFISLPPSIDTRKVAADGFPAQNIIASDLKKRQSSFFPSHYVAAHFVQGDAFDPDILSVLPSARGPTREPLPDLSVLMSLNPLHAHCSVINTPAFFHLFDEEKQLHLARALAGLLSPQPGSIICGMQMGKKEKGVSSQITYGTQYDFFVHSTKRCGMEWSLRRARCRSWLIGRKSFHGASRG